MVSVVICTYNRAAMLDAALRSLVQVDSPPALPWEIVVVDNNSTDDTVEVIRRWEARGPIPVIGVRETRQGKSYALNRGIATARGELLAFTDDDVTFDRGWLRELAASFEAPDVMGVGGRIEAVWAGPAPAWWSGKGPYRLHAAVVYFDEGPQAVDLRKMLPVGANMAFRRVVFERHGGFREDLGPVPGALIRGEDSEMARRAMKGGERIVYSPRALVYHPVETSRATRSYFRRWYRDFGRTRARWEGRPFSRVYWFGVPRYMFRQLAESAGRAMSRAFGPNGFYWELQMHELMGQMFEYCRMRHEQRSATRLPDRDPSA
jgi:glycosyltransferase involved in cell wall biosynthesis